MKAKHTHISPQSGSLKFVVFQTGELEEIPMEIGWEVLSKIIPPGRAGEIAAEMNITLDGMHRWMRKANSNENPNATGRVNPIDRVVRLIKAVHDVNPEDTHQIVDVFVSALAELEGGRVGPAMSPTEIEAMLRARARDLVQAADAIAANKSKKK